MQEATQVYARIYSYLINIGLSSQNSLFKITPFNNFLCFIGCLMSEAIKLLKMTANELK